MKELVDFKSNLSIRKLILTWLILSSILILSWLFLIFQFDKVIAIFIVIINAVVLAAIFYIKMGIKVVICQQEQVVTYYWMKLWARKYQVSVDIKSANISLKLINYRGNDLWELIIFNSNDPEKKISITELTDGFDEGQIKKMYELLKQISGN